MKSPLSQATVFVVVTFVVSFYFQYQFIFQGGLEANRGLIPILMWTPGIIGILCSLAFGHRLKDLGFRSFGGKDLLIAYGVPVVAAILLLVLSTIWGVAELKEPRKLFKVLVYAPTVGVFLGFLRAIGEEIGWRGFLHARLVEAKVRYPYVITGVVWGAWHLPAILFADYATSDLPYLSACFFMIGITGMSIFVGYQRERTGSVWLSGITHASHNTWIQRIYPAFLVPGPLDQYYGGESGFFGAFLYAMMGAVILKRIKSGP